MQGVITVIRSGVKWNVESGILSLLILSLLFITTYNNNNGIKEETVAHY